MGWNGVQIKVTALLSAHNSDKDERHEALWAELQRQIRALVESPQFEEIRPEFYGWDNE